MTTNSQLDVSQFDQPLADVRQEVDLLHGYLDGFAAGTTRELKGQQARDAIYHALEDIDHQLKQMRELRAAATPLLRGYVTRSMCTRLEHVTALVEAVTRRLRPSLPEGVGVLLSEIRMVLSSLEEDMHVVDGSQSPRSPRPRRSV